MADVKVIALVDQRYKNDRYSAGDSFSVDSYVARVLAAVGKVSIAESVSTGGAVDTSQEARALLESSPEVYEPQDSAAHAYERRDMVAEPPQPPKRRRRRKSKASKASKGSQVDNNQDDGNACESLDEI